MPVLDQQILKSRVHLRNISMLFFQIVQDFSTSQEMMAYDWDAHAQNCSMTIASIGDFSETLR